MKNKIPPKAVYLIVFAIAFVLFFVLQYSHTLADPDSYYHAKMALLMKNQLVIKEFPWLGEFTVLGEAYTNQHYLYHVFLIPFVTFFNPIAGLKLATIILASLFLVVFYWLLKKIKIRFPLAFTLMLLTMNPLVFRLSLAKAPSVSLIILFIGIYFIINKRWKELALLSFIYVWAYGGFTLIVLASGLFLMVDLTANVFIKVWRSGRLTRIGWLNLLFPWPVWRMFMAAIVGVIAGIVINPYFPQNLDYYRYQLFEIGVKNYGQIIGVGSEWYSYEPLSLISATVFLSIALVIAAAIMFIKIRKQTRREAFFLLLTLIFLALTVKSRRYVEYYVPAGCLFSFAVIGTYLKSIKLREYWKTFLEFYFRKKIIVSIIIIYFLVSIPTVIVHHFLNERRDLVNGIPFTRFQAASNWLTKHSDAGDIVFHSSWDEFPVLFYHNDKNYYIGGLDQTFMYLHNSDLHKKWVDITTGSLTQGIYQIIKDDFRARYVLSSQKHRQFKKTLEDTVGFRKVYEDAEAVIYQVSCCAHE